MGRPRQNRRVTTTASAALMVAAMAVGTSCFPDPVTHPAAPTLPTGIGFDWIRDTGGTTSEGGTYTPGYSQLRLLDGVVEGPTPVAPSATAFGPAAARSIAMYNIPIFPDGTARFPWNGFAGEGITTEVSTATTPTGTTTTYDVTGAGGTCSFTNESTTHPTRKVSAAIPSPDGTKLAVYSQYQDFDAANVTWMSIHDLDDTCALRSERSYNWSSYIDVSGERILSSMTVWAPDSSEVLYPVGWPTSGGSSRVDRLGVNGVPTPSVVLSDSDSTLFPLGWSPAGRVLVTRQTHGTGVTTTSSSIETVPVDGGAPKVIDAKTSAAPMTEFATHFGYFVPGTSQVLYTGGPRTTTLGGSVWAWPQIRLHDDATGGDGPVAETDAPLATHTTFGGEVPNVEFIERFVR